MLVSNAPTILTILAGFSFIGGLLYFLINRGEREKRKILNTILVHIIAGISFESLGRIYVRGFGGVYYFLTKSWEIDSKVLEKAIGDILFQIPISELERIKIRRVSIDAYGISQRIETVRRSAISIKKS